MVAGNTLGFMSTSQMWTTTGLPLRQRPSAKAGVCELNGSIGVVCVIETGAMAAVYLRPHSPPMVCGGHRTRERSTQSGSFANALNAIMKNVWFGPFGRGMYHRAGLGGCGWGEQAVRPDGDGPPKYRRCNNIYEERCQVTAIHKRWQSICPEFCEA